MPYLSALEVCSRRGAIQIHVYLTLPCDDDDDDADVDAQNYQMVKKRRLCRLSDLLELQRAQKLREKKWKDHMSHQHQVEHALLDMTGVLPSTVADEELEQKNALVSTAFYSFMY